MIKQGNGLYTFKIFSLHPSVVALISTKASGNFLPLKNKDFRPLGILGTIGISASRIALAEQVHGSQVAWVQDVQGKKFFEGVDALATDQKNIFLLILMADCVPVLFYDSEREVIAIAHSGWKGALQKISLKVVEKLIKMGSKKENILVAIGSGIGKCHYDILSSRAKLFDNAFGKEIVTEKREGKIYLDLVKAVKKPLVDLGIPENNIKEANLCTYENETDFYSFRRDEGFKGEMAAIIGLKEN